MVIAEVAAAEFVCSHLCSSWMLSRAGAMPRVKNSATVAILAKALRGSIRVFDESSFSHSCIQTILDRNQEVIVDLLKVSPRPTAKLLKDAAKEAFRVEDGAAQMFAERITSAISWCRTE